MPTTIVAQNGAEIKQTTKIAISGCPKVKKAARKKAKRASKHIKRASKHKKGAAGRRRRPIGMPSAALKLRTGST
ncbi:MAG TPA: hypothetical protein VIC06_01945 [Solirubrobacteraceae bacterium]